MTLRTALFAGVCLACLCGAATSAERPNIIFILSDDLAQGDVGCYGQKLIQTPNLNRMAQEGTRFTQAYSGTTVCAPSGMQHLPERLIGRVCRDINGTEVIWEFFKSHPKP